MNHYTNEELIDLIRDDAPIQSDTNITRSKKALAIIGNLIMLSNLEENKRNGYVYRSNEDLAADVETDETTLRRCINKLIQGGYLTRRVGDRKDGKASEYALNWELVTDKPWTMQTTATPSATPTSTPSATPTSTPSATPTSTPSATPLFEEMVNSLMLKINELQETLKRLEQKVDTIATPTSTPSATPLSVQLPPPDTDIEIDIEEDVNINDPLNIIEENDIKENGKIYQKDEIESNEENKSNDILTKRNDNMKNEIDLLKLWDKLYKEDTSTIEGTIKYITDDLTTRWLHRVNKWEELENNLNCAKMAARTTSNYPELKQFSTEEQRQIINQVVTNLENSANKRIQRMKEKQALSAKTKHSTVEIKPSTEKEETIPTEQQPTSAVDISVLSEEMRNALNEEAEKRCQPINKNFRTESELNDALQHLIYLLDKNEKEWTDEGNDCSEYFNYLREYATNKANDKRKRMQREAIANQRLPKADRTPTFATQATISLGTID